MSGPRALRRWAAVAASTPALFAVVGPPAAGASAGAAPRPPAVVRVGPAVLPAVVEAVPSTVRAAVAPATSAGLPLAADSPFDGDGGSSSSGGDDRAADATPSTVRLDRLAAQLRSEPLAVDPEVDWMFDAATRRALGRTLTGARVPVLVAALPMLDEDESGGDTRRILRTLQQRVGRKALYVVVDPRGTMDIASVGVPLDLSIPYSLMRPELDDRPYTEQARDPGPPPWASVPDRLRQIVATTAEAGPGEPNGLVDDLRPLPVLGEDYAGSRLREDTIFLSVTGAVLGLGAAALVLGLRRVVRRGPPTGGAGRSGGGQRRGGRRRRGRRGGARRA